jgi:SAM-dependent methyltransferase
MASSDYVMGGEQSELDRLLLQCEDLRAEAVYLLDQVAPEAGWRAVDVGCGPLGILDVLAERVGPTGRVVGVERESRFVEMARAELTRRGLGRVEVIEGDATATGLPRSSFDLVHERLVLLQQPDPFPILQEMVALVRPGGYVMVEDIDEASWICHPPHPAYDALLDAFHTMLDRAGMDVHLGRKLPDLLRRVGLEEVTAEGHTGVSPLGDRRRMHLLALVGPLQSRLVQAGILDEVTVRELIEEVEAHLSRSDTVVIRQLHCQAWGRKPPDARP